MGRARSNQLPAQTVTVGSFEALLGVRRGSAAAQARRDNDEAAQRQAAIQAGLVSFLVAVNAATTSLPLALAADLAVAYRLSTRTEDAGLAARRRLQALDDGFIREEMVEEMVVILGIGDPPSCPGLTEPALSALCSYFNNDEHNCLNPRRAMLDAGLVVEGLFRDRQTADYYQRKERLCSAIAPLISDNEGSGIGSLGFAVAHALEAAPDRALAGPLRPWIDAYVKRIDGGRASRLERQQLAKVLAKHAPGSRSSACSAALAELSLRLAGN